MPCGIDFGPLIRRPAKFFRNLFPRFHKKRRVNPSNEDVQTSPTLTTRAHRSSTGYRNGQQEDATTGETTIHDGGEEVEEGAVYHVTLKRVQIHQAANKGARWLGVEEDQLPPEHTVSQYETCKIRTIKAGTLEKLVENLLTAFGDNDFTYISVFLSTYRAFASTKDVLELLLDRYGNLDTSSYEDGFQNSSESNAALRTTIASILRAWLDQCSEDFREPPNHPCLLKLLDYLKRSIPGSDPERRAQNLLEQFHNQDVENTGGFYDTSFSSLDVEEELDISNLDELEFSFFQDTLVAEQLTYMDAKLFKKVVPHHCLGSIWSKRNKKENEHLVPTVRATITQFNAVTKCVVSTILKSKELKIQQRAKIIEKWIHVAHECRILKNFSSLRAIISALQSNSIYHLKKSWACVPKDIVLLFEELSDIFSNNDNSLTSRELLMKEGTSKFANLDSSVRENQKRTQRRLQLQKDMGVMQGTVPYLGTFLTDLIMLDTAFHDYIEGGLINFEKRRKEFEVIAQIKLLQSACNSYCLTPDKRFIQWFQRQQNLTEEESYNISREIEASADTSSTSPKSRKSMVKRFSLLFVGSDVIVHSTPVKEQQPPAPGGSPAESTDSASISSSDLNHSESEDVCSTLKSASDSEPQNKLFDTSTSPEGGTSETSCFSISSTATPSSQPAFLTPASVSSPKDKCPVSNSTSASEFRCSISDSIDKCSISVSQCSDPNATNSVSISHSSATSSTSIPLTDTTSSICKATYSICSATGSSSASKDKDADCDPKDMDSDCDSKDKDSDGDCQDKDSDGDCQDKDSDGDCKDKDSDPLSHSDSCSFSYSNSRSNSCSDSHSDSRSRSNSHSDSDCDNKGSGSTDKDYDFGSPTKRSDSRNKACTTSEDLRPVYNQQNSDSCIIRVSMDNNNGNMYKSILITCQDKTHAVIQRAMLKHNLESDTVKEYELVQVISEAKELVLPHTANVFYAMNSHVNYDFILRKKASVSGEGKTRGLCSVMFSRTADKRGHGTNRHSKFAP